MKTPVLLALVTAVTVFTTVTASFAATIPPNRDPKHPRPSFGVDSTYHCGGELGYLKRVHADQLEGIFDPQDVSIVTVCENDDYGLMRSEGNAGALRTQIAQNSAMADALQAANFGADDVVGIRMTGEDKVILYVHTFLYR